MRLQFARALSFACRGRLRTLLADCSTDGLYCATITRQQIFERSLQATVEGVFPHESRAPTVFFSTQICFISRPGCQGRNKLWWRSSQVGSLAPHVRTWDLSEANILFAIVRAMWKTFGPLQKNPDGPFNISKHLDSCVLFRANRKLAPWAAVFQNLTKLN